MFCNFGSFWGPFFGAFFYCVLGKWPQQVNAQRGEIPISNEQSPYKSPFSWTVHRFCVMRITISLFLEPRFPPFYILLKTSANFPMEHEIIPNYFFFCNIHHRFQTTSTTKNCKKPQFLSHSPHAKSTQQPFSGNFLIRSPTLPSFKVPWTSLLILLTFNRKFQGTFKEGRLFETLKTIHQQAKARNPRIAQEVREEPWSARRGLDMVYAFKQALTQGSLIRLYQDYFNGLGLF